MRLPGRRSTIPANESTRRGNQVVTQNGEDEGIQEVEATRHAGFLIRFVASLIDIVVMGIPIVVLALIVFGSDAGEIVGFDWTYTGTGGDTQTTRIALSIADIVQIVVLGGATIWLWVNWDGRTPGKKITRTRVRLLARLRPAVVRHECSQDACGRGERAATVCRLRGDRANDRTSRRQAWIPRPGRGHVRGARRP